MYSQILLIAGLICAGSLLLAALVSVLSHRHFRNGFNTDVRVLLSNNPADSAALLTESDLANVPEIIKKYIHYSGAVNKPKVINFAVKLQGSLRQDEKSQWMIFTSQQYNGVVQPARLFFMEAIMKHFPVTGYHRCVNGSASMDIKLLSLIRVQHSDGPLMDIAETVTMFNDMCVMAPGTLIDSRIKWSGVRDRSVVASFSSGGIVISAELHFSREGALIEFISHDRYAIQPDGSMQRYPWSTPLGEYRDFHGARLASHAEAILRYPTGDFCYGKFKVADVRYNVV